MDSAPDGRLAALVVTEHTRGRRTEIVVFDDSGNAGWRAETPAQLNIGDSSWIAMSDDRVIVARHDGTLFAWDTTTRRRVVEGFRRGPALVPG